MGIAANVDAPGVAVAVVSLGIPPFSSPSVLAVDGVRESERSMSVSRGGGGSPVVASRAEPDALSLLMVAAAAAASAVHACRTWLGLQSCQ